MNYPHKTNYIMIEWISNNKEWFFSGLGVFMLTILVGIIKSVFSGKKRDERTINMKGDKSIYVERNDGEINVN